MNRLGALVYDRIVMKRSQEAGLADARRDALSLAQGDVLEIGAGTGLNIPSYPRAGITRLVLTEPHEPMRRQIEAKAGAAPAPVEVVDAAVERLPFDDATFDTVTGTLVLCEADDPAGAVDEIARVLKPGGTALFLEHGAAPDAGVAKWQRRIEPVWKRIGGNCHLTRLISGAYAQAGFAVDRQAAVLARLAASRCTDDARARMADALAQTADCARRDDRLGYAQANAVLHELIYQTSGNDFMVEQTRLARLRIAPYRGQLFEKPGRLARSHAEHVAGVPHLASVVVDPHARGRGLAADLCARLTRDALAAGAPVVTLGMYSDNDAARRVYTGLGFVVDRDFVSGYLPGRDPHPGADPVREAPADGAGTA